MKPTTVAALAAATAAATLLLSGSLTTAADNAQNGKRLAQRWCAACHIIEPGQAAGRTEAPPFSEIAKRPDFNAGRVALFLLDPHPKMPDLGLSRDAASDLAAYIASQGSRGDRAPLPAAPLPSRRTGAIGGWISALVD